MKKKIGETFSVTREVSGGTGYSYYLVKLSGGLAFVDSERTSLQENICGGKVIQTFTFLCVQEGDAAYQLAYLRPFDLSDALYENIIPVKIGEELDRNMAGGWTQYHEVNASDMKVFNEAFENFLGVNYTPITVKTQIVQGTNYCFLTKAQVVSPGAEPYYALVYIYKALEGKAVITNIVKVEENALKSL